MSWPRHNVFAPSPAHYWCVLEAFSLFPTQELRLLRYDLFFLYLVMCLSVLVKPQPFCSRPHNNAAARNGFYHAPGYGDDG